MRYFGGREGVFFVILTLALLQSCSQLNVSVTTVAPRGTRGADSTSSGGSRDSVSAVRPMMPLYSMGDTAFGGTQWYFVSWAPATAHNGTYALLEANTGTAAQISRLYSYYGFRRAVVTYPYRSEYEGAGFDGSQLLVVIGYQGLDADWKTAVEVCRGNVLGYMVDEPSGYVNADSMRYLKNMISAENSTLWLDDYDTGVIPDNLILSFFHNSHIVDWNTLYFADALMCDADNAQITNGATPAGTYLAQNYEEFLNPPDSAGTFSTIYTTPPYENVADVLSWIGSHTAKVKNFALYLQAGWTWSDVDSFAAYAYHAGFLGQYQKLKQAEYICLLNNVTFGPSSSDSRDTLFGVWTKGVYAGPVDASAVGATPCWSIQTWVSQNQYQTIYAH